MMSTKLFADSGDYGYCSKTGHKGMIVDLEPAQHQHLAPQISSIIDLVHLVEIHRGSSTPSTMSCAYLHDHAESCGMCRAGRHSLLSRLNRFEFNS